MIGILVVTHSRLGEALIEASEFITGGKQEALASVSIDLNKDVDKLREKIARGIKSVDGKQGILILTDMFGGTPSNLSYSFLEEGRIEVLSGVNLPVLIQAVTLRKNRKLSEMASELEAFGKKSISLASAILKGNKRR
jgi:PTS system mannose-specific IIA component